jgi:amino-acid N-acetyltransferase
MPDITLRPARPSDTKAIIGLVNRYAAQGLMLPRAHAQVLERIRDYVVAVDGVGERVGVAALSPVAEDLAEIRSLAVDERWKGKGLGRELVTRCLEDARALGFRRVFALTYQTSFFGKMGFKTVERLTLPQKIWRDCVHCAKFDACDEVAVLRDLERP